MGEEKKRIEIRLSGSGGQGLVTAGIILAQAVGIHDGKHVVQTQSYGPEARGGASKAEVVISDSVIHYPKAQKLDILLAMTQEACDKYYFDLKPEGILIVDDTFVKHVPTNMAYRAPITKIARDVVGKVVTANIVALGVLGGLTDIVSRKALEATIMEKVPKGTEAINMKALEEGYRVAEKLKREHMVERGESRPVSGFDSDFDQDLDDRDLS